MNKKKYKRELQKMITYIEENDLKSKYYSPTLNDPFLSTMGVKFIKNNLLNILVQMMFLKHKVDKKKKIKYLAYFESYVGLVYYDTIKTVDLYKWLKDIVKLGEQNEKQ